MEQLGDTAPVWRIIISGRHVGEDVPGVPDAASTLILLGLGLTALSTARRLVHF